MEKKSACFLVRQELETQKKHNPVHLEVAQHDDQSSLAVWREQLLWEELAREMGREEARRWLSQEIAEAAFAKDVTAEAFSIASWWADRLLQRQCIGVDLPRGAYGHAPLGGSLDEIPLLVDSVEKAPDEFVAPAGRDNADEFGSRAISSQHAVARHNHVSRPRAQ